MKTSKLIHQIESAPSFSSENIQEIFASMEKFGKLKASEFLPVILAIINKVKALDPKGETRATSELLGTLISFIPKGMITTSLSPEKTEPVFAALRDFSPKAFVGFADFISREARDHNVEIAPTKKHPQAMSGKTAAGIIENFNDRYFGLIVGSSLHKFCEMVDFVKQSGCNFSAVYPHFLEKASTVLAGNIIDNPEKEKLLKSIFAIIAENEKPANTIALDYSGAINPLTNFMERVKEKSANDTSYHKSWSNFWNDRAPKLIEEFNSGLLSGESTTDEKQGGVVVTSHKGPLSDGRKNSIGSAER